MDFPQYRKLSNDLVFYRIQNDREFDEIQLIGKKAVQHHVKALQYPEILRIKDMLELHGDHYLTSSKEEFEKMFSLI